MHESRMEVPQVCQRWFPEGPLRGLKGLPPCSMSHWLNCPHLENINKKVFPLSQRKVNRTDAKKHSPHVTVTGYSSNLPRIIF